jgi:hypothetical protein
MRCVAGVRKPRWTLVVPDSGLAAPYSFGLMRDYFVHDLFTGRPPL